MSLPSHSLGVTTSPIITGSRPDLVVALYDAIHLAIARGWGLTIEYATAGETVKLRTIYPIELTTTRATSDNQPVADLIHAADSLRDGIVTFRVDRIRALIALTRFTTPLVV